MRIDSHNRRLSRLEADSGTANTEPLVFSLHEWAGRPPLREDEADDDTVAQMEAKALDRLIEAGEIGDEDRERVQFVVRVIVAPSSAEQ
jgi:hypothetical protein